MKANHALVFALAAALLPAMHLSAAESTIPCKTLPEAVTQSARQEVKSATISGCSKDRENGQLLYEMSLLENGKTRDLTFDAYGKLLESEQQVALSEVPSKVAEAIHAASPAGEVLKVEALAKQGEVVSYEASVRKNGRVREIAFTPDGTPMKPE